MIHYPHITIKSLKVKDSETGWYMEIIDENGIKHTDFENRGNSKELVEFMIIYRYCTRRFSGATNIYKKFVEEVLGYFNAPTETMKGIMDAFNYIKNLPFEDMNLSISEFNIKCDKRLKEARTFLIYQLSDLFQKWKKEVYLPKTKNRSIIKI